MIKDEVKKLAKEHPGEIYKILQEGSFSLCSFVGGSGCIGCQYLSVCKDIGMRSCTSITMKYLKENHPECCL